MTDTLLVSLDDVGQPIEWAIFSGAEQTESGQVSSVSDLVEKAQGMPVIALLSGKFVTLSELEVSAQQQRHLKKILPGLMEESLASDIEELHFAIGHKIADETGDKKAGKIPVAVVEHTVMAYWFDKFKSLDMNLVALIPDCLALPLNQDGWTLQLEDSNWMVRIAKQSGFVCDNESIQQLLPKMIETWGHPDSVQCFVPEEKQGDLKFDFPVDFRSENVGGLSYFPDISASGMNLLQGMYRPPSNYQKQWRRWRFVAILAGLTLFTHLPSTAMQTYKLNQQAKQYKMEVEVLFHQTFPEEMRLVNPRVQMEEQIEKLQSQSGSSGFLVLFQQMTPALQSVSNTTLTRIKYDRQQGAIELDIKADNYAQLDQLRSELQKMQLQVEQGSVSGRQGAYTVRFEIKRGTGQ